MAVSVDTVYQRVLALANKEQRGYITPQEFNLLANQAQMVIFEEYFHDLNQYLRNPGNDSNFSDSVDYIEDKISFHKIYDEKVDFNKKQDHEIPLPPYVYRLTNVMLDGKVCQQYDFKKFRLAMRAGWNASIQAENPIYVRKFSPESASVLEGTGSTICVYGRNAVGNKFDVAIDGVTIDYIKKPKMVNWDYVVVNEKALYNSNGSSNFDLHPSEETTLVYRILELGGVVVNKPGLASAAKTSSVEGTNNEKQ